MPKETEAREVQMTVDSNDWRLQGQEKYLQGAVLQRKGYQAYRADWEHDHCEFCGAEFSLKTQGALQVGYASLDHYRWICEACFGDFKDVMGWTLREAPPPG